MFLDQKEFESPVKLFSSVDSNSEHLSVELVSVETSKQGGCLRDVVATQIDIWMDVCVHMLHLVSLSWY